MANWKVKNFSYEIVACFRCQHFISLSAFCCFHSTMNSNLLHFCKLRGRIWINSMSHFILLPSTDVDDDLNRSRIECPTYLQHPNVSSWRSRAISLNCHHSHLDTEIKESKNYTTSGSIYQFPSNHTKWFNFFCCSVQHSQLNVEEEEEIGRDSVWKILYRNIKKDETIFGFTFMFVLCYVVVVIHMMVNPLSG